MAASGGTARRVQRFLALVAPVYDLLVGPAMRAKARLAADLLGPMAGLSALDVGTGTGILARELAGRGAAVTGVDLSPAMLQCAIARGGTGVAYRLADATALPFPDGSFDLACAMMMLHELEPAGRTLALAEMRRVSRGRLLIVDWARRPGGRLWRWGTALVEWAEGGNYPEFVATGLANILQGAGLAVEAYAEANAVGFCVCRQG